jgi:hypothetical protein
MDAIDSVGAIMNRTYYGFTRLYDGIRTTAEEKWPPDTVLQRRARARTLRDEYYNRDMVLKARLCAVFGDRVAARFGSVDSTLRSASRMLSDYEADPSRRIATWDSIEAYGVSTQALLTDMVAIASDTLPIERARCALGGSKRGPTDEKTGS